MKYLGYGGTSTIFKGALCLCYRLKTNKLKSDIHVNMPQKRKFSLSLGRKHNRTIKRSAHDLGLRDDHGIHDEFNTNLP